MSITSIEALFHEAELKIVRKEFFRVHLLPYKSATQSGIVPSLRSRQLEKAKNLYKQLIDIDKNNAYYLSTYIDLIVMTGNYESGITALESLITIEGVID